LARAASTAATELGRPTDSGRNNWGNSTVFLIGRTGNVCTATTSAIVITLHVNAHQEHAVMVLRADLRGVETDRQRDPALEAAVGDFHLVATAAGFDGPVPAQSVDG